MRQRHGPFHLLLAALSLPALTAQAPVIQDVGPGIDPAISADGRWLAFASGRAGSRYLHLWVQPTSGGEGHQVTAGLHDDREPAFSPDGRMLAYRSEINGGGIYLIPVRGGRPRLFAQAGRRPRFSPDGRRMAYWVSTNTKGSLFVGDVTGSRPRPFHA